MPEWGLTKAMRETRPYGLIEWWLEPGKVITDPVHGDVFVTRLEAAFLDTPQMQRLRRVRQLGTTHLVYPGATHTRFSHSLGAVRVAQELLDVVAGQRDRNRPVPDLFQEWTQTAAPGHDAQAEVTDEPEVARRRDVDSRDPALAKLAEATVLARLGALLHDISHLPYGHSIEDDLRLLSPHDEDATRFERIWNAMLAAVEARVREGAARREKREADPQAWIDGLQPLRDQGRLKRDLRPLILSKEKGSADKRIEPTEALEDYPFVADLVGNTICADLLDYLPRDHRFTGLPLSLGRRFMASFYVTPSNIGGLYQKRMALQIHRDGRPRRDVVTEILKHLRYRYELQERVLAHHTKLSADAMIGKMLELWYEAELANIRGWAEARRVRELEEIDGAFPDAQVAGQELLPEERIARWRLEQLLLSRGDDGVLEYLSETRVRKDSPGGFARELAQALRDRHLYKHAANALQAHAAKDLYEKFGSPDERRRLERAAFVHARLDQPWHVILWVPDPKMRLKLAEVLVDHGEGIAKFVDYSAKGSDIYDDHRRLWTISVFVHPTVSSAQTKAVLAKLSERTGLSWDRYRQELGVSPTMAPHFLAASQAADIDRSLARVYELVRRNHNELAARADDPTHEDLLDFYRERRERDED